MPEKHSVKPLEAKWAVRHFLVLRELDRVFSEMANQLDGAMSARQMSGGVNCQRPVVKWTFEDWGLVRCLEKASEWTGGCSQEVAPGLARVRLESEQLLDFVRREFQTRDSMNHYQNGLSLLHGLRALSRLLGALREAAEDRMMEALPVPPD